jgi:hypothetical protein
MPARPAGAPGLDDPPKLTVILPAQLEFTSRHFHCHHPAPSAASWRSRSAFTRASRQAGPTRWRALIGRAPERGWSGPAPAHQRRAAAWRRAERGDRARALGEGVAQRQTLSRPATRGYRRRPTRGASATRATPRCPGMSCLARPADFSSASPARTGAGISAAPTRVDRELFFFRDLRSLLGGARLSVRARVLLRHSPATLGARVRFHPVPPGDVGTCVRSRARP